MKLGQYKRSANPGSYPNGMPIALEYDGDEIPAQIGIIIGCFAAIERELPGIIARVTKMNAPDAVTICAELISFSSRLKILEALLKLRDENSHDRIIYGHCKNLLTEANAIRNKYAHASYGKGKVMQMLPFHNDLKGPEKWLDIAPELKKDKRRMSIILGELFALLHEKELPSALYDKLLPQDK